MRKDRNRVSFLHRAADKIQFLQQIRFFSEEIHWAHLHGSLPNRKRLRCSTFGFWGCRYVGRELHERNPGEFNQQMPDVLGEGRGLLGLPPLLRTELES